MALPVDASVQAAYSFVRSMHLAREFMQGQDPATAEARYEALLTQTQQARRRLKWNPATGRPASFLQAQSDQGRALAEQAQGLAAAHGLSELRELVLKPYVLLYAHSQDRVVLLALKHERQLSFAGGLAVSASKPDRLAGIAKGAPKGGYRDRKDRY